MHFLSLYLRIFFQARYSYAKKITASLDVKFIIACVSEHLSVFYTCQLFVRYKRETFLPGVRGIFEDDTIISEDSRRSLKSSEEFRSLPKTSEVFRRRLKSYDAYKHELASSAFYFKKSEITRKELSFIHFKHGFELHIFGSCVNQDGNNSHFLIRREKLARRREPA